MSLFGFEESGQATTTGLININCNEVTSNNFIINNSTLPIDVGATLIALQAEIDAIHSGPREPRVPLDREEKKDRPGRKDPQETGQ